MAQQAIDLSAGFVPKQQPDIDLSAGFVPKAQEPPPAQKVPANHWLAATGQTLTDLAKGFGEGALQTETSISRVLNKIPIVGETLAPTAGVNAARLLATPANTTQKVGAGIEQGAELLAPMPKVGLAAKIGIGALQGGASVAAHEGGTAAGVHWKDMATGAVLGAALPAAEGGIKAALNSKLARGAVNESVMATARDVTYGNPAKAILDEGIATPFTGDLEKFKDAIRSGSTLQGAADAAGGRIAAVSDKINEIAPQLQSVLAKAKTPIPASTVTDVIDDGIAAIKANRGVTQAEADAATSELEAIKQAALKVPGIPVGNTTAGAGKAVAWRPLEANAVKQEIGQSVNWAGRERIGQLVDPVKKQVYGALKEAVNSAAPGSARLNERLTNLLAAQSDVNKLAGFEEVGRGRSMGGVIGPSWMGRVEALAGRLIPGISWLTPASTNVAKSGAIPLASQSQ